MEDEVREHRDPSVETGTASSGPAEDPAGMSPDEAKGVDLQAFASSADIVPTTRERKDSEHENDAGAESNGSLLAEDLLEPEVEATPLANDKTLAFDPWDKVHPPSFTRAVQTREAPPAYRRTVHYVIQGTAEGAPAKNMLKPYFILSSLSTRRDTQLITICPITGSLNYKGIPQLDLFRNEGDARAYLTANLGLRIVNVVKGDAILGSFVSGSQFNVCLVTKSETCMCLPSGESVYNINEVKWVPVKLAYPIVSAYAGNFAQMVTDFNIATLHYYTDPFVDVTRPYPSAHDKPDKFFVWNQFVCRGFKQAGLDAWTVRMIQGVAVGRTVSLNNTKIPTGMRERLTRFYKKHNPEKLSDLQKVLEKYAEAPEELFDRLKRKYGDEPPPEESSPAGDTSAAAEGVREEEQPTHANLCLITRRWRRYPGTRFNARGIDQTGAPANELECELIMSTQHTWASFIWRRGSVPVGWYSSLASNIKMGQPAFCIKESPFDHSYKYWDHLANRFAGWGEDGKPPPISCLSLLQTEPEHGELVLVETFQESLRKLKSERKSVNVDLFGFDWHRTTKQLGLATTVEGAWRLVAGPLKQYGISHGAVKSSSEFDGENALVSMRSPVRAAGKGDREKKPGVGAFGVIRGLVSQQKLRFTEGDFNLDLTYITPKLIAMGFPSHGAEGYYRNRVDDVERFFASRHAGHFRIYNLCTEREYDNANRFGGCYRRWPFEDHNAPAPIGMIPDLVKDATSYLAEDPKNVIAAHCKAGKGRTGVMLSALLMAGAAPDLVPPYSATAAMGFFGAARTKDGLGVTIPSQRRYIQYYETMLKHHNGQVPPKAAFQITKIVIQSPVRTGGNSPTLYVLIHEGPKFVKSQMGSQYFERDETRLMCDSRKIEPPQQAGARFTLFDFHAEKDRQGNVPIVTGDTKITFVATRSILRGDESLFHVWFNTSFIDSEAVARGDPLRFTKSELDKACKDEKHAAIRRDLQVEVYLQPVGRKGKLSEKEVRTPLQKPPSADFAVRKTSSDDKLASSTKDRQKDDTVDDGLHDGKDRVTSVVDVIEDDEEEEESPESPMTESSLEHKGTNSSMRLSFTARNDDDEDLETTRASDVVETSILERQKGILRLNCVDSLDRTNLASFFMALQIVAELRRAVGTNTDTPAYPLEGKTLTEVRTSLGEEIVNYLAEAFVANGDVCSFLYTNTPATHTAAIRELSPRLAQAQSNMALSVMRRYQNTVHDNNRHNGFFAFLGLLKKPRTPPTVHSERGAAVISEVPHARMTAADASVLLHSPPSGEFPWVAPAVEAVSFTIVMPPTVSEVTEVGLCFRTDPSGDDECFPLNLDVSCGTMLQTMCVTQSTTPIARAPDATWLFYKMETAAPVGTQVVTVKLSGGLSSTMVIGGIRILGPHVDIGDAAEPIPSDQPGCHLISKQPSKRIYALSEYAQLQTLTLQAPSVESLVISTGLVLGNLTRVSESCIVNGDDGISVCLDVLAKLVMIEHKTCDEVSILSVAASRVPPPVFRPPVPPSAGLRAHKMRLSRKRPRVIASGQDSELLNALFVLIPEGETIVGLRVITASTTQQARGMVVGVSDDENVQTVPSTAARQAVTKYTEELTVPRCHEGTQLDYHFAAPIKGSLVRIDVLPLAVDSPFVAAAKVYVLVA
ncbi:Phosphatidylinositol 3 [Diplonema papillatum]|nr:Phosphatidylinositol 3 [Diplonema papillatum]